MAHACGARLRQTEVLHRPENIILRFASVSGTDTLYLFGVSQGDRLLFRAFMSEFL